MMYVSKPYKRYKALAYISMPDLGKVLTWVTRHDCPWIDI